MNEYKPVLDIEPVDKYQKTVKDWNQFAQSFMDLTPQEKNRFMVELRNSLMTNYMLNMFQQLF
ncbi:MAG: hypothetical protein IKF58_09200 [Bacillus sp. (in: Bacteria)]|nr:hypothetical protein [Bacillus sp. (in: firmicutes)]